MVNICRFTLYFINSWSTSIAQLLHLFCVNRKTVFMDQEYHLLFLFSGLSFPYSVSLSLFLLRTFPSSPLFSLSLQLRGIFHPMRPVFFWTFKLVYACLHFSAQYFHCYSYNLREKCIAIVFNIQNTVYNGKLFKMNATPCILCIRLHIVNPLLLEWKCFASKRIES